MSSLFTKIIQGQIPSYKIAEDDKYYAFLDINPLAKGHALVVPKLEKDYIFDQEDEVLAGLIVFSKKVAIAIEKSVVCKRIGIVVLGLEVPHTHIHLIPINSENDISFSNSRVKFTKEEFIEIATEISRNVNF